MSDGEDSPETEKKGQELKVGHLRDFYIQQNEGGIIASGKREGSQDLLSSHRSGDDNDMHHHTPQIGSGGNVSNDSQIEPKDGNGSAATDQQRSKVSNLFTQLYAIVFGGVQAKDMEKESVHLSNEFYCLVTAGFTG